MSDFTLQQECHTVIEDVKVQAWENDTTSNLINGLLFIWRPTLKDNLELRI